MKFEVVNDNVMEIWIGDPCYIIDDWSAFCEAVVDRVHETGEGVFVKTPAGTMFVISTAYGDGNYSVKQAGKTVGHIGVDAGLICAMPKMMALSFSDDLHLGLIVVDRFEPRGKNHNMKTGSVKVNTNG